MSVFFDSLPNNFHGLHSDNMHNMWEKESLDIWIHVSIYRDAILG